MIAALVHASTIFKAPEWIALAARAYDFIAATMQFTDAQGQSRLAHGWRAGVLVKPALALDHAAMMGAALALHEARNYGDTAASAPDDLSDAAGWAEVVRAYRPD